MIREETLLFFLKSEKIRYEHMRENHVNDPQRNMSDAINWNVYNEHIDTIERYIKKIERGELSE